ncbi:hypothetical protein A2477_01550 [Candidatus Falkowbacteria bacterium RIFOXYC2_FULL_47_12]|uniref:UPF0102 protein A2477_01550 n=2 Tax=Candidatus Falkowiibacteriota TaxID=1752728 RepID=A0A1F5TMN4_9BACT|nr:MAG: hypothetical protein A2242_01185 [Candidatus Falkowbacteria bacterium RIFOXYA2_FULL_47_9]OGF40232.1 MAG: hypothetical protein A2477_01550 [Candidatus Falkowbacteria bacterium RIFOXYC2_FULL_47_12]
MSSDGTKNKVIGAYGEQLACDYLERRGYEIIRRNYKASYKELDIVARREDMLIFVEVKTRTSNWYGGGEEAVTYQKQQAMKKAIGSFLYRERVWHRDVRADVITILVSKANKTARIRHYENIL